MMCFILLLVGFQDVVVQNTTSISGKIMGRGGKDAITGVELTLEGMTAKVHSDSNGHFGLDTDLFGEFILSLSYPGYRTKRIPLLLEGKPIDLGILILEEDILVEQTDNLVTLTEADLTDDSGSIENATGLLQATRDIFLSRAAFDFGQAFFRVRGYDSKNGEVFINGIPMNRLFNGRPQWNNWGGLNDVTRNQEFSNGLNTFDYGFGGILGNTNINMRPSGFRAGTRLSASASNRTYAGRLMATYNSGKSAKGSSYSLSTSRRWAKEGFVKGTLYDALSFFAAFEHELNPKNTVMASMLLAKNRRGRSSAVTEEVFGLLGNQYNPYWGNQNGSIRNSRERAIFEPIFMLNHYYESKGFRLASGATYQFGKHKRSRLGFFNAPNPDPTYYRYLPSFYINNPSGADFTNANLAREGLLNNPQLNWANTYAANAATVNQGKAAYLLYDDVVDGNRFIVSSTANCTLNERVQIDFGITYQNLLSDNYAEISDLLGADFHEDMDSFSRTQNDLNGNLRKEKGERFGYNYNLLASRWSGFAQVKATLNKWNGFLSVEFENNHFGRRGLFQNERFANTSMGNSPTLTFLSLATKGGIRHQINGRHWLQLNAAYLDRPPTMQHLFINARESNQYVPDLQSETVSTLDLSYFIRLPQLTGRFTAFHTFFQNTTDINFFFVDSGLGSDFVQEVVTGSDQLHKGIEIGLDYQISSNVKLSFAANLGEYVYTNNPSSTINFDTAGQEEPINQEGNIDLGKANIKGYKLAQGPQTAFALGVEYRDPKYWWMGVTANYLADNYASISTITRTQSFLLDPDTGEPFIDATDENVSALLRQRSLDDFYLLNLVAGKSWLVKGNYASIFFSMNNVFETTFRTGGYEQSRNGNFRQLQQDNLRNNPTFAPKYWYGFGRTYFLNIAFGF